MQSRTLHVDLATGEWHVEERENATLLERIGGIGRALPWLRDHTSRVDDPFAPANPLYVNVGILTGTKVMTGLRTYFTAYSPLKRSLEDVPGVTYSAASGNLGQEIAYAGVHDFVLNGACNEPRYLNVEGVFPKLRVELREAAALQGLRTTESVQWLKERHPQHHFAVIGPAGEHRVRYASIACSTDRQTQRGGKFMRFAGRGGMGAVMGAKNLFALAVHGEDRKQRDLPSDLLKPLNQLIARGEDTEKYRRWGTWRYNVEALTGPAGGLPVFNFGAANHPDAKRLTHDGVTQTHDVADENCVQCGIKCWKIVHSKDGQPIAKVDYEPCDLLGPNLGIFDVGQISELIWLCDDLGLDAITMGGVLGYLMDNQLEGMSFGAFADAKQLIEDVAHGRNAFAALGVKAMSERVGIRGNAIHVHGLELAAYLGNTDPATAFALAGNHMSMATYGLAANRGVTTIEGWLEALPNVGLLTLLNDMSGVCKFAKLQLPDQARLLTALGVPCGPDELRQACMDVYKIGRLIDARQGFTADDDVLPARCHERLPGQGIPQFNTRAFFDEFKSRAYATLGIGYDQLLETLK